MDPTNPNIPASPGRDIISAVVQGCGCDEEKATELLKVCFVTIELKVPKCIDYFISVRKTIQSGPSSFTACCQSIMTE
jgi:hypothetical protein